MVTLVEDDFGYDVCAHRSVQSCYEACGLHGEHGSQYRLPKVDKELFPKVVFVTEPEFKDYVTSRIQDGFHITKDAGLFICDV